MAEEEIAVFSRPPRKRSSTRQHAQPEGPATKQVKEADTGANTNVPTAGPDDGNSETTVSSFKELGLSAWMASVCSSLGMKSPTPVQRACIPPILAGRDVIAVSHTGTGKTAAFAMPILQRMARDPYGIYGLVLTPTRELALQLTDHFRALGAGMTLRIAVVIGGVSDLEQARALTARPHLVVATPGRLATLMRSDNELAAPFTRLAVLVLDEADRMLDATFEPELETVLGALPETRQTLLFSATMTTTLRELQRSLLRDAFFFEAYRGLETAARLTERYVLVPQKVKDVYLAWMLGNLDALGAKSAVVFASTRRNCSLLGHLLAELGLPAACLHSGRSQRERGAALDRFRAGTVPVLVATDVASRGLDIPDVDLVINYDLPLLARDYVHRVGRTARAGRRGGALSFVTQYDVKLVQAVEELLGKRLEKYEPPENQILEDITRVYTARRVAALRVTEEEEETERLRPAREKKRVGADGGSARRDQEDWLGKKARNGESVNTEST